MLKVVLMGEKMGKCLDNVMELMIIKGKGGLGK